MVKSNIVRALAWVLKQLAGATIRRYRPGVIGITGSAGKTSTKLAVAAVLGRDRSVRVSPGNFNNELGLPLTILGDWKKITGIRFWPNVLIASLSQLLSRRSDYPHLLILEYGIDRPGDMRHLISVARPDVAVLTAIGDIPVHVEYFEGPEAVVREKAQLIECLPSASFAVLNHDSDIVMSLRDRTRAHVATYGFGKGAHVRIVHFDHWVEDGVPLGIRFALEYGGSSVPVRIAGAFGKTQAYAAAAGACIGIIFGMNLPTIADALADYRPPPHRLELLRGVKEGTWVIDDSYNASPLSMRTALETFRDLPAKRRIAVLGDMLEIGSYAAEAHEHVGRLAAGIANVLITVGPRAKFIAEAARSSGMRKGNVFSFDTPEEAHPKAQELMKKGDLVLVKASRGIHLDRVVEEIRAF